MNIFSFVHHHISVMELGHLLTRSSLMYPEVFSKVYHDFFCQLGSSISLPWVIYFKAFYLHVVSSFSCIPVICPKLVLFLSPLQFVHFSFVRNFEHRCGENFLCYLLRIYVSVCLPVDIMHRNGPQSFIFCGYY